MYKDMALQTKLFCVCKKSYEYVHCLRAGVRFTNSEEKKKSV